MGLPRHLRVDVPEQLAGSLGREICRSEASRVCQSLPSAGGDDLDELLGQGVLIPHRGDEGGAGAHLDQRRLSLTPGGYDEFVRIRTERAMQQNRAVEKIAAERARSQMSTALPVPASAALRTATFAVSKMDCAACSGQIVTALKKTPGVYDAHVDFAAKRAAVRYDPIRVSVPQVLAVIDGVGFPATEVTTR